MITKEMSLFDVLQKYPEAREVFKKHGMHCVDCMGSRQETVEAGAKMHGINLDILLKELNALKNS